MASLDDIMERASNALSRMDYLTCETLCLDALALARSDANWADYARILLPLQEARRQRRMIAAQGIIRLGTSDLTGPAIDLLDQIQEGCIVLTQPHTADDADQLHHAARKQRLHVEVLLAVNPSDADTWRMQSFTGPAVACHRPAPPTPWREAWLPAGTTPDLGDATTSLSATPADWFLDTAEALGDAALEQTPEQRVETLEPLLAVAPDHEILHQRLADAARRRRTTGKNT